MPSYAFNRSGSPPGDHRSRLGGPCNIPIILLTLCECPPERLPCLVEYLKATQQLPRPYPRFTSYLYNVYETIPPLVTSWYTIWAKVIVIVATSRRVITVSKSQIDAYFAEGLGGMDARPFRSAYTLQQHLDVLDPFGRSEEHSLNSSHLE